ncbi:circularly permuted type 2 ATP-grasp protein [Aquisphaera insulae]|uniref:circularly permuted type 2 ATP-grasp protein n=1 Tax=Aquisphaera insulae TaxID=2712864 RepID=UPI0013EA7B15|nr:circularly permuted type 2 ATP-grasp protein [Aquisphaera insulae]
MPALTSGAEVHEEWAGHGPGASAWGAYGGIGGSYDEAKGPDGEVRGHWKPYIEAVENLGIGEVRRRWEESQDLIRQNGVTYNVYGDPRGMDRPWQLDPIPVLITPEEWSRLAEGLVQRARLLDLILADIYGPMRLLSRGFLPPELVFGNPGFLHPCHGLQVPMNRRLHLYAVELGRAADGTIMVLGDRTQAPSGSGYALENRIVLSRMLPDVFRDCRVERLAPFFQSVRDLLQSIAPHNRDNPRIVLLTPGPYNETYFEHAYLAGYLGYTLVEGGDLLVRGNRVYLKLLGGLQPVDVILRRLDDDYCDPLELRGQSFLGVPGLLQVLRAGNVTMANALGSGVVETPGILAYLPAICREVLGEELKVPWAESWWCGEPVGMGHVLSKLPRLVIKPAFAHRRFEPIFGDRLGPSQLRELSDRIRARPGDFVGQEQVELSSVPVMVGDRLEPRYQTIRVFLAAREEGYAIMPGGLTRVASSADTKVVTMQRGGGSKDTWILADGPVTSFSLLPSPHRSIRLSRAGGDLSSRHADNFYWLGRYVERAEQVVRLLRGIIARLTEKSGMVEVPELPLLLKALTTLTQTFPGFLEEGEASVDRPEEELLSVIFDRERPGSLSSTLAMLQRVAAKVRDRISVDMWRTLSQLMVDLMANLNAMAASALADGEEEGDGPRPDLAPTDSRAVLSEVLEILDAGVNRLAAFSGLVAENLTRGQSWTFLDMGRRLERSLQTSGLLRGMLSVQGRAESCVLEALLEIADSTMTYRRRYLSTLQAAPVLDLLLADETNPRSLAFQLAALAESIDRLPRDPSLAGRSVEQRLVLANLSAIRLADVDALAKAGEGGHRPRLEDLLRRTEADLPILSEVIAASYFSHLQTSRHLGNHAAGPPTPTPPPMPPPAVGPEDQPEADESIAKGPAPGP